MMKVFYLITFSSLLLQTPFLVMADRQLIENTCKATPSYELCLKVLLADPKSQKADITGLAIIMVNAVNGKANQIIKQIKSLQTSKPKLGPALKECGEDYNAVVKADVPSAIQALNGGIPKFAEDGMADTAVEAQACERIFGEHRQPSPFTEMNKSMQDLANVARAVIRNLLIANK